jgi:hypothetical protein
MVQGAALQAALKKSLFAELQLFLKKNQGECCNLKLCLDFFYIIFKSQFEEELLWFYH